MIYFFVNFDNSLSKMRSCFFRPPTFSSVLSLLSVLKLCFAEIKIDFQVSGFKRGFEENDEQKQYFDEFFRIF